MTSTRWSLRIACGLAAAAVLGCQNADEIRHYQVPREQRLRMLAAIAPHGERTWFLKVVGPEHAVEAQKKAFRNFIASLRFNDKKGEPPISWTAPEGWREVKAQPKQGEFRRYATFRLPPEEKGKGEDLELTVFPLGREGQAADVLANVNRWRGQLGLKDVNAEQLEGVTSKMKVGDTDVVLFDQVGTGSRLAATRPPFADQKAPPRPAVEQEEEAAPTYDVPKGWQSARNKAFSVATFRAGAGEKAAEVTVSPLGGGAGGLVMNVNRWRGQVGLPEVGAAEIQRGVKEIEVAGAKVPYVEVVGPDKGGQRTAIFGAIAARGPRTWFFKMTGPPDVVEGQRANFEAFVRSVQFNARKEGPP